LSSFSYCCSFTRFERKKGIGLALMALHELQQRQPGSNAVLVVAGGYDVRLAENREHLVELQQLAQQLGIEQQVLFVPSFTDRCGHQHFGHSYAASLYITLRV
jgi:alpha-1,3/alpha-1,6-mannosyltransferase